MKPRLPAAIAAAALLCYGAADARLFEADSGDVRITGIPMVLQNGRSFCAPATMVRVLRYYGIVADQQALAEQAGCTEESGTDVENMLAVIAKICDGLNMKVDAILGFDYDRHAAKISKYNRIAKARNKPTLKLGKRHIDLSAAFADADIGILRETATPRELRKFAGTVRKHVGEETPLIWGMVLGIAPERNMAPYTRGGHLRLIIGYNDKTDEIVYSDPWGPKHAVKHMPMADAYAITMSLHALKPTQARDKGGAASTNSAAALRSPAPQLHP